MLTPCSAVKDDWRAVITTVFQSAIETPSERFEEAESE